MRIRFIYILFASLMFAVAAPQSQAQSMSNKEKRQQARKFEQHIVNQGETAYSISKRYGITVTELADDNQGIDITHLPIGASLRIRKDSMGKSGTQSIDKSMDKLSKTLNDSSSQYIYHIIEKGETFYSLTHKHNTTEQQLRNDNENLAEGLKAGAIIKIRKQGATEIETPTQIAPIPEPEHERIRQISAGERVNIAMMLPLKSSGAKGFYEFYQGALIALEDLKSKGYSAELNIFNVDKSPSVVDEIIDDNRLNNINLIIGPVYEQAMEPVISFARKKGIAVVSPLASVENIESSMLYVMPPTSQSKYNKLREDILTGGDQNVVMITTSNDDAEFVREVKHILPNGYATFNYSSSMATSELERIIDGNRENIFVVASSSETTIDQLLARISSIQSNFIARSIKNPIIKIVGSSRWQRFTNIDKNLFFKLNLCFVTNYIAERNNPQVAQFDKRYVAAFGSLPSLFSYRGYDAVKLFVPAVIDSDGSFNYKVNALDSRPLQTPYKFSETDSKSFLNNQWALVIYHDDYTVEVR